MIHIEKNYYIDADESQFMLVRMTGKKDKKTGKEVKDYLSYHATISQAVKAYLRMQERNVVRNDDMELKAALSSFEKVADRLQRLIDSSTEVK